MKRFRKRCTEPGCMSMSDSRGMCQMHYKRWQAWGDALAPTRKAAALFLALAMLGCAQAPVEPQACVVPPTYVLVSKSTADEFAEEINALRDENERLEAAMTKAQLDAAKWKARNDCS